MTDESALRAVLMAVMLVLLPIGVYHRVRSQASGEKLDRRQEGLFILATLRPVGAVFWLAVFAWMINPAWSARFGDRYQRYMDRTGRFLPRLGRSAR